MKNFLIALIIFTTNILFAQSNQIVISGKVIEKNSQEPIEFVTVVVVDKFNTTPITAVTTNSLGEFKVVSKKSEISIELSFIGFENKTITDFEIINGKVNLGTILMHQKSQHLDEILVRSERSQTEFKLDKRVFNVGKDLSSTGASALEVLNNVPSVNVNIEGEISLRGSTGVQILVNGKPSVLASEQGNALGTITAEMIQQIEVITNPSAKYDAEGTSGIINIIIKKEERKGINGSVTVNTGIPHNHSVGLSLNRRTEKFNLFSQLGVGYRNLPRETIITNKDLLNQTSIYSESLGDKFETFYNLILGTDYHINKNNVLTLSGKYAFENEDQPSLTHFMREDSTGEIKSIWDRHEATLATNPKYRYELQYTSHLKGNKDHTLLMSALGNFFGKKQSSEYSEVVTLGNDAFSDQQTTTDFREGKYTFSVDYTNPLSEFVTLETGAQYVINNVSNDYEVRNSINEEWISDPNTTNVFDYDQKVLGIYGTGSYENDIWGIKLGLRLENTDLKTLLVNTNEKNNRNFNNYFPTLHTSFKFTETFSMQGGYSRRIFRPRLWHLNPFFNISNNFSIRTGNPNLLPEFTDSYEISSIYIEGKSSLNMSVYHRYTTDVMERVSSFENNINTTKPINIGTKRSTGVELNSKYNANKSISINIDFNYNYYTRQGELDATSFDFSADQWSSKVTTKINFPSDIDFEITGQYRSRYQSVQSEIADNIFADLGLRKKILNGKGVINLSIRDLFASRIRESETNQEDFYLFYSSSRGRFITIGFSYGFGKGEAMEFSGQKRRH